jgi:hypothetical protein
LLRNVFLLAYVLTELRLDNTQEREQKLDMAEMSERAKKGLPLYGESDLTPYLQGLAHRQSSWSQTFFHTVPWCDIVSLFYIGSLSLSWACLAE